MNPLSRVRWPMALLTGLLFAGRMAWGGKLPTVSPPETRLQNEIQKMLDAPGHLRPAYLNANEIYLPTVVGNFMSNASDEYWNNPAETIYTLIRALPHLPPDLKAQTRSYIQEEWLLAPPTHYSHTGWSGRVQREIFDIPPDRLSGFIGGRNAPGTYDDWAGYSFNPFNVYACWLYAKEFGGAETILNQVALKVKKVPDTLADDKPHLLNMYIAGYIGYLELIKLVSASKPSYALPSGALTPAETAIQLGKAYDKRVAAFSIAMEWLIGVEAGGFLYLVPEAAEELRARALSQAQTAVTHYNDFSAPYWFVSRMDEVMRTSEMGPSGRKEEGSTSVYFAYSSLFNAKAMILKEDRAALEKYLDVPAVWRGDLYYIQNLVATIEAGDSPASPPSAPFFSPAGGTFSAPVTVSLSAGGAPIRYTTDGQDPTAASTLYSAPITLSANTLLKARAFANGQESAVSSAQYVIAVGGGAGLIAGTGSAMEPGTSVPDTARIAEMISDAVTEARAAYGSGKPEVVFIINNASGMPALVKAVQDEFGADVPIAGAGTADAKYNTVTAEEFVAPGNRSMAVLALGGDDITGVFTAQVSTGGAWSNFEAIKDMGKSLAQQLSGNINATDPNVVNLIHLFGPAHNPNMIHILDGMKTVLGDPIPQHIKIIGAAAADNGNSVLNGTITPKSVTGALIQGTFKIALRGIGQNFPGNPAQDSAAAVQQVIDDLDGASPDVLFYVPGHPDINIPSSSTYAQVHDAVLPVVGSQTAIFGHTGGGEYGHMTTSGPTVAQIKSFFIAGLKGNGVVSPDVTPPLPPDGFRVK